MNVRTNYVRESWKMDDNRCRFICFIQELWMITLCSAMIWPLDTVRFGIPWKKITDFIVCGGVIQVFLSMLEAPPHQVMDRDFTHHLIKIPQTGIIANTRQDMVLTMPLFAVHR